MRYLTLAIALIVAVPAFAQQPSTPPTATLTTPMDQALGQKLMDEINQNIQLRAQLLQAQAEAKNCPDKAKPDAKH